MAGADEPLAGGPFDQDEGADDDRRDDAEHRRPVQDEADVDQPPVERDVRHDQRRGKEYETIGVGHRKIAGIGVQVDPRRIQRVARKNEERRRDEQPCRASPLDALRGCNRKHAASQCGEQRKAEQRPRGSPQESHGIEPQRDDAEDARAPNHDRGRDEKIAQRLGCAPSPARAACRNSRHTRPRMLPPRARKTRCRCERRRRPTSTARQTQTAR